MLGLGVMAMSCSSYTMAEDFSINLSGFARAQTSVLLEDHKETTKNDAGRLNMARGSLQLEADVKTYDVFWKVITRFDKEVRTNYLKDLESLTKVQTPGGLATRTNYLDQYDTDTWSEFFREFYVDFKVGERVDVRLGKQQLVWGESDFFQALDLVHGYDYRKRLFYDNNEDWRKPLTLANFNVDLYELGGNLNFYIRPGGIDAWEDMGSTYNLEGGRTIPHPYRGVDFTAVTGYNTRNSKGDWKDTTYGIRWNGTMGSMGYSLVYLKTFNPTPIMNPAVNSAAPGQFGVNSMRSYGGLARNNVLGDWIYPEIDVVGFTLNDYNAKLDATLSAEVAYTFKKPFNFGALDSSLPGWAGVKEKDTLTTMIRIDKELKLSNLLGTSRPSLSSLQLFDTWIVNYKKNDDIVEFASFGSRKKKHTTYLTLFTLLNYKRDTINPSFVVGTDLSNGGGFAIPAIELVFGDNWRAKAEANLWWNDGDKKKVSSPDDLSNRNPLGIIENSAAFMDWFAGDNQLTFTLTRQF